MKRLCCISICVCLLLFGVGGLQVSSARTQSIDGSGVMLANLQSNDEPVPKGDEPSEKKTSEEPEEKADKKADEPSGKDEPTTPKAGEPVGKDEPGGKKEGEPSPSGNEPAVVQSAEVKAKTGASYGLGFRFQGIFVPTWFLNAFLDASTPVNSVSLGGEVIRRKGDFDIIASINFGFYSPRNGNYMSKGKSYEKDVDFIQFRNLNLLSLEGAFIWHYEFNPWISFIYGAGLGIGFVMGNIYRISDDNCTPENVNDTGQCYPRGMDLTNRDKWLAEHTCSGPDTVNEPCLYREDGVWPVIPMIHLLVGANFKINDQFSVRVDGGFHDAFYLGATGNYFFF